MLNLQLTFERQDEVPRLRSRESVWTKDFAIALAIAFLLHLSFLLVRSPERVPSATAAYLPLAQVVIQMDGVGSVSSVDELPRQSLPRPELPTLPDRPAETRLLQTKRLEAPGVLFRQIEEIDIALDVFDIPIRGPSTSVAVEISGPLSDWMILRDGTQSLTAEEINSVKKTEVCIYLAVDGQSGRVLWARVPGEYRDTAAGPLAKRIAMNMVFARTGDFFPREGTLRVRFI